MSNTTQAHTNFGFLVEHSPLLHKLGLLAETYYANEPIDKPSTKPLKRVNATL